MFLFFFVYKALSETKNVCIVGYIMDKLCIDKGNLVDNPSLKTLDAGSPQAHSLHCMFDVKDCVDNGYTVLCSK